MTGLRTNRTPAEVGGPASPVPIFTEPFRIVDLGVFLDQANYPPWGFTSKVIDHQRGAAAMANFFNVRGADGGRVGREDFPEEMGLGWMDVHLSDHAGNHIDAPWHFPVVEGRPAKTIDEVPLQWCCGPGVRLDFRSHLGRDIGVGDLREQLQATGAQVGPGTIVWLWTGADAFIDDDDRYFQCRGGLSVAGLNWLLDRGVKLIGIDAYAMDVSSETMRKAQLSDTPQFLPLHFVGRAREHMHLEELTNLGELPRASGFFFSALPMTLRGGSAGWVRPVAMVPESHFPNSAATS
jgi:kynurenine formamidase